MKTAVLKVHPIWSVVIGIIILGSLSLTQHCLKAQTRSRQEQAEHLRQTRDELNIALDHYTALMDLKTHDVTEFKTGMSNLAQSKQQLYEAGLSLQEEKRLLEKQWEIMTTYLVVDLPLQRVILMHGDQPVDSYLFNHVPIKAFGAMTESLPKTTRVVSKERFANPERGQAKVVEGHLLWIPPQVGTSVRSNALGEFVLFTNSRFILHGPAIEPEAHEAYPHFCLGLSRETARELYRRSFIGTKIVLIKPDELL